MTFRPQHEIRSGVTGLVLAILCLTGNRLEASRTKFHLDTDARPDLELQSDLWSSIFLKSSDDADGPDGPNATARSASSVTERQRSVSSAHPSIQSDADQSEFQGDMAVVRLEEQFLDLGAYSDATETTECFDDDAGAESALTDWEQAVLVATGVRKKSSQNGPSIITGVVAVVGAIVVGGAYFKSNRRA